MKGFELASIPPLKNESAGDQKIAKIEESAAVYLPLKENLEEKASKLEEFLKKIESRKLADFKHWTLYLDQKQYYLGRVFLWTKRPEATDSDSLTKAEWDELFDIKLIIRKMYEDTFQPDLVNQAFLANEMRHCHMHFVPRYETPREFAGRKFIDANYGHNYSRDNTKATEILSAELYTQLCAKLKAALSKPNVYSKTKSKTHSFKNI